MTTKYSFSLLSAIILTTGIVLAQQSPNPATPPSSPAEPQVPGFSLLFDGGGFLGVHAEDINRENMGQYNLNQARGVGVTQIVKDSPAEKAGLRKGDVILRVDGENVSSVRKLNRLVSEIAPDQTVKVVISRAGSEQEINATIGKRKNINLVQDFGIGKPQIWKWDGSSGDMDSDKVFTFGGGRRIGVSTIELTKQLADYFGIAGGKGVLVTSVTGDGPAAKAGIKAGDVITAVDGEQVTGTGDISRAINNKKEGDVTLTIIRNKSQLTIPVTPKDGDFPFGTPGARPQSGRRIVIPRIEIPDMDIQVPAIPVINIQLPRVMPKVRIVKSASSSI